MRIFFFFILMASCLSANSQTPKNCIVSGCIKDTRGVPIHQALVAVEGSDVGVYSDAEGQYSIEILPAKQTLSVSAFGYNTEHRTLDGNQNQKIDFRLQLQAINLSTVEVYGKSKNQQLRESNLSVNAIDIRSSASSLNSLTSAIGRCSGIRIREEGGVGADFDLSINGLSGNSVRYFIDGIPMSTIGNSINLSNLPVNIVNRVEIYKGVVPTQLGADALGGAINIITNKSITNYLDVSYGIGSFNTHKAELNGRYVDSRTKLFINPSFNINYSKNNYKMKGVEVLDPESDPNSSEFKKADVKRFHDGFFSLLGQVNIGVTDLKWADLLSVTLSYSKTDKELQTGSVQNVVYGKAERKNDAYAVIGQYQKKDLFLSGLSANLSFSHTWDNSIVIDTAYRKYRWDGSYIESSRNEIRGRGRSIRHIKRPQTTVRTNLNYVLNPYHSFNLNYMLNQVKNNLYDEVDPDFQSSNDLLGKHIIGFSYNQNFVDERLNNTFFLKNYINHLEIGLQDLSWITGSAAMPQSSTSTHWGYGAAARFRIADYLALKGSYEHSIRLPLSREYLGNGTTVYPNFGLKPENSNNFNLGVFGTIAIAPQHKLYYEATGFARRVNNYIVLAREKLEGTVQYQNISHVSIKGVEGEVRYDYNNMLELAVNISYLDEKNKTKYQANGQPEIAYNDQIPNKPWLYSNSEINFKKQGVFGQKTSQLKLSYFFQYVHWFYFAWKAYGSFESKDAIPTQYLHNASLTYSFKNERYNISLECNNLLDRMVYDNYMLQKPGRSFFCKLRLFIN